MMTEEDQQRPENLARAIRAIVTKLDRLQEAIVSWSRPWTGADRMTLATS